jgi:hypothetical protein
MRCAIMGGDWMYLDEWSGLQHFFIVRKEWQGEFEDKWMSFKKSLSDTSSTAESTTPAAGVSSGVAPATVDVDVVNAPVGGAKGGAAAKAPAKGGAAAKALAKGGAAAKALAKGGAAAKDLAKSVGAKADVVESGTPTKSDRMKESSRIKVLIGKHQTAGNTLLARIDSNDIYKWARNDDNRGVLQITLHKLEEQMTDMHHDLLVSDTKAVQKNYSEATFDHEIESFRALRPFVDAVARATTMLLEIKAKRDMHA